MCQLREPKVWWKCRISLAKAIFFDVLFNQLQNCGYMMLQKQRSICNQTYYLIKRSHIQGNNRNYLIGHILSHTDQIGL